jgi:ribonuclease P/MRP protein subunit RPP1
MYEAVRPYPGGDATPARFARVAGAAGYEGIVLRWSPDVAMAGDGFDPPWSLPDDDGAAATVDAVHALEIDGGDRDRLARLLRAHRDDVPVIVARTTAPAATRFAAERERIDVLRPTPDAVPEHATVGTAAAHGVRIAVDLGVVLRDDGGSRVRTLGTLRTLVADLRDRDAQYVVTGAPASHLAIRAPGDLAALGAALDVPGDWLLDGLAEWGRIARLNRERAAPPAGEPGVRVVGAGTDESADAASGGADRDGGPS